MPDYSGEYPFQWRAHFYDGAILNQFDDDAEHTQHKFNELEARAADIDFIEIVGLPMPLVMNLPKNSTPIIFDRIRRSKTVGADDTNQERWTFFGYENNGHKSFIVIHHATGLVSIEYNESTIRS